MTDIAELLRQPLSVSMFRNPSDLYAEMASRCLTAANTIESLRSRAEKAEAERGMHERASAKWYQSYQFKEATCEKLAEALEKIAEKGIGWSNYVRTDKSKPFITDGEIARDALAAYRKEASE